MAARKKIEEANEPEELKVVSDKDLDAETQALLAEAEEMTAVLEAEDKAASRRSLVILLSHFKLSQKNGRGLKEIMAKIQGSGLMEDSIDTSTVEGLTELASVVEEIVELLVGKTKAEQIHKDLEGDGLRLVMLFLEMMDLAEVKKA